MVHIAGSFWSYHYSKNHFSTEDAQVTGHLLPVSSRIAHLSTIGIPPLSQISGLSYRLIESRLLPQALLPSFNDVYAAVSIEALLILFPAFLFECLPYPEFPNPEISDDGPPIPLLNLWGFIHTG